MLNELWALQFKAMHSCISHLSWTLFKGACTRWCNKVQQSTTGHFVEAINDHELMMMVSSKNDFSLKYFYYTPLSKPIYRLLTRCFLKKIFASALLLGRLYKIPHACSQTTCICSCFVQNYCMLKRLP